MALGHDFINKTCTTLENFITCIHVGIIFVIFSFIQTPAFYEKLKLITLDKSYYNTNV